jgi:hypothetical protein
MIAPMMDTKDKSDLSQFPRRSLKDCLRLGKLLLEKISNTQVDPHVAIGAIGYSTMNGAAMSALGALRHYGLIEGPRGKGVSATTVLVRASRSDDQALLTELAFRPVVFRHLKEGGFDTCTDDILMKHLEGRGLSARAARDAVKIFRANTAFLVAASDSPASGPPAPPALPALPVPASPSAGPPRSAPPTAKQLATYSFPLAGCDASLVFSGAQLGSEDLAILREHLDVIGRTLAKRQPKSGR